MQMCQQYKKYSKITNLILIIEFLVDLKSISINFNKSYPLRVLIQDLIAKICYEKCVIRNCDTRNAFRQDFL